MSTSRAADIAIGTVIGGRYLVDSLLGRGGMATVYRATDVPLGRSVALKVFGADAEGASSLGRESSEVQLLASLNHHALVTLFDASIDDDDHSYLVMELVEGPTLAERIDGAPIAGLDAAQLLVDLSEALHVVHGNGVVHRDIKPANILLGPSALREIEFRAKLSDFGIAYLIDSTRLTMTGAIIGTAAYLSPEQARGVAPGAPSDIYSLGLVALEALTATRAFPGSMIESLSARLVADPAIPATLGAGWTSLLARMTDRDPDARPTALEVLDAARAIERGLYGASTVEPTAVLAAAATSESSPSDDATEQFAAPTRVMPAAPADTATVVLDAPTPSAPVETRRVSRARILLAVAAVVVVLVGGVVAWGAVTTADGDAGAESTPTPLPVNEGELGTHLDELLGSVTP